ncbi:hypothetical protein V1387_10430 [Allomuricauda taeanensis]|uniref:hypothetical protein n=1 Tax=Flagellimonas taeanensis TaxID=1005926 RepID=UPI002E7AE769|nr:hypothetical protein [Allomuricauda taeanensis]MEE1963100.1 hypothetical protein [Allomuricauda taeanensis]
MINISSVLVWYGLSKGTLRKVVKCEVLDVVEGDTKIKSLNVNFDLEQVKERGEAIRNYMRVNRDNIKCADLKRAVGI